MQPCSMALAKAYKLINSATAGGALLSVIIETTCYNILHWDEAHLEALVSD